MSERQMLGYHPDSTWIHRLNGTSKLVFLIVVSVACMTTYDTRYLLGMSVVSLV
ncbi:MAG: energy-coupling factor transporter transmembrane protein EcfT, partial [Enterococcaceae bacterium]|nr:energy-coupling factor transporter transmembrane protein EcfT [Enterococcaceae bacterium]